MTYQMLQAMSPVESTPSLGFNDYVPTGTDTAEAEAYERLNRERQLGEDNDLSGDDLDALADAGYNLGD